MIGENVRKIEDRGEGWWVKLRAIREGKREGGC